MIKYICDVCENEITSRNEAVNGRHRLSAQVKSRDGKRVMSIEVMTGLDGTTNDGHFCKYCVIDALTKLDDRPKDVTP